jgi:hypothetical protein
MCNGLQFARAFLLSHLAMMACVAQISQQPNTPGTLVDLDHPASSTEFPIAVKGTLRRSTLRRAL